MFVTDGTYSIVVVLATYNRAHLLKRSLKLYEKSEALLLVMDDDSNDDTYMICKLSSCPIYYIQLPSKNGKWRDSASILNRGISHAIYKFRALTIFITHPEIIPGLETINACKDLAVSNSTWINAKGYYLGIDQQKILDSIDWKTDPLNIRKLPGFYNDSVSEFQNKDYTPDSIDKIDVWDSWIFGGGSADMWNAFGGLTEFETWGSVDVDLLNRRVKLNMDTVTPKSEKAIVIHQNHDDPAYNVLTPRNMEKCMAVLPDYNSEDPRKPNLISNQRWQL